MSGETNSFDSRERDDPMIAAEYALGLLEGEELLSARGREASDPEFAWRKAWWDNWFAPWSDEISGAEPSPELWSRIEVAINEHSAARAEAELAGEGGNAANVVDLTARLRRWQWATGLTSAAAAVLAAVLVFSPGSNPVPGPEAPPTPAIAAASPLVASIPIGDTSLRLGVTYLPASGEMLVSASGLAADGVHDHELWLVPADGSDLQSLGVIVPGEERRVALPAEITGNVGDGVQLVLTREPLGGKPEGEAAGPVVAEGAFSAV